uniref:DNA replication licensing factor MCM3 n=1 Tax=Tetraselmis sp. GSL018 TaxID=582737 RepID=A0A061S633_9CHLO|eukprot:CAMPEP_0177594638 /NCGR_PEP_ID=MMETSP0419_2-20121207/9891_1 /TAXON_ID=582737 /ORGANISM="Tetraselmis sp., Strain GSL018" /LENGTH=813 /DNA_ID=CAMNT_0019085967 /DNA_START=185 /DNA_END=2626 /DNA_ORIENTATION=-
MDAASEQQLELKRKFLEFLDLDYGHGEYASRIGELLSEDEKRFRLNVNVADLRTFDLELHDRLLNEPGEVLPAFENALDESVRSRDPKWLPEGQRMHIGLEGEFGAHSVSPRQLTAPLMSKVVNVRGIVTKCSLVRPKMCRSVHYCQATNQSISREYRDVTSHDGPPTGSAYPTKDESGNLLTTEYGLCHYRDSQMVTVQELPETSPPGQLPRSVDIIVEDDLVDECKPGDRVEITGVYKAVPPAAKGSVSGVFRSVLCAVSVRQLSRKLSFGSLSRADLDHIKEIAAREDILQLLGRSLAPSIFGHDTPKQALVLLLLGGMEKNLPNGTHLRGDINCLLVGDPGVAKSQLLRSVMNFAPLAINTTGRGSSGVGLTAAVTVDKDTGEKRLEAGAMVLADRGVVCIDEFDKMSDLDRVAIHEVMEQQTVTIAKAGLHTTLNARCSVVAAANPLYGSYEASLNKAKNINLPDSLLSRFDLIFIMLDELSNDGAISEHVLSQHRFRARGDTVGVQEEDIDALLGIDADEEEQEDGGSQVYVKYNRLLHGPRRRRGDVREQLPLSKPFMRKYIHYAKERIRPELTASASDEIAAYYTSLRQFQACPKVTVRMLETVIRLSTAHAKLRLSNLVEASDVEAIKHILDTVTGFQSINPAPDENIAEALPASAKAKKSVRKTERRRSSKGAKRTREAAGRSGGGDEDDEASASDRDDDDEDAALADAAEGESGSEDERDEPARGSGQYPMRQLVQVLQAQFVLYQPRAARGEAIELDAVLTDLAERHGMPGVPRSLLVRAIDEGVPDVMVDEEANAVYFTS